MWRAEVRAFWKLGPSASGPPSVLGRFLETKCLGPYDLFLKFGRHSSIKRIRVTQLGRHGTPGHQIQPRKA